MALFRGIQEYISLDANNIVSISGNIFLYPPQGHLILYNYYPYKAFGGQNKIVYSTRLVTRRAIILLPGVHVTNHLTLIYVYD